MDEEDKNDVSAPVEMDPLKIPIGNNNRIIRKVDFKFGQSSLYRSFLSLSSGDAEDGSRWNIPDDIVPKDHHSKMGRLNMSNLEVNYDPFWFKMGTNTNGSRKTASPARISKRMLRHFAQLTSI